ncbi:MAG: hypothetical protein EOP06_20960 [Proteobacteria bacterium]|nr:MAG: hypothetical protein EOP06_20960 [Pseudomonadota bacterium]
MIAAVSTGQIAPQGLRDAPEKGDTVPDAVSSGVGMAQGNIPATDEVPSVHRSDDPPRRWWEIWKAQ